MVFFKAEACTVEASETPNLAVVGAAPTLRANFISERSLNVEVSDCDSDCAGSSPAARTNFNRGIE